MILILCYIVVMLAVYATIIVGVIVILVKGLFWGFNFKIKGDIKGDDGDITLPTLWKLSIEVPKDMWDELTEVFNPKKDV